MTTRPSFDTGASAYDRFMGRWSRLYIPALLAAGRVGPRQRVLDVATGTGEATLSAASLVGPSGWVLGVDLSLPMLRAARAKVAGKPVGLAAMDGQALACKDDTFDVVLCQLGLMFLPDVLRGLEEFRRVLRPGGRVAACVWSTRQRVPLIGILAEVLGRHVPHYLQDVNLGFSLGDPHRLASLLTKAGFHDVSVTAEVRECVFESFDEYWAPVEAGGGRLGQIYRELDDQARRAVADEVRRRLSEFESEGRLLLKPEALIGAGSR